MSASFAGKVAIVTGAGSGIGRAASLQLAAAGAHVLLADIKGLDGTLALVKQGGGSAIAVPTDVRRQGDVAAMVAAALAKFGRLDLAFNNAGVAQVRRGPLPDLDEANWQHVMDTNLKSVFLCMKHEIPAMLAGGGGAIVNTSSGVVPHGYKDISIYVASKAGVDALTRVAAMEFAGRNIRVNGVNPGFVATPLIDEIVPPAEQGRLAAMTPLGKMTSAEDVADLALFLLSPQAGHITGQSVYVDGGLNVSF